MGTASTNKRTGYLNVGYGTGDEAPKVSEAEWTDKSQLKEVED